MATAKNTAADQLADQETKQAAQAPQANAKPARKPLWERVPRDEHSGKGGAYDAQPGGARQLTHRTQEPKDQA